MTDRPSGMPLGIFNKNPGNIEKVGGQNWQGLAPKSQQTDPVYWIFTDAKWGIRAIGVDFQTMQRRDGLKTLRQMITKWAPPEDNDTAAYIADVARRTGEDPDDPLNVLDLGILKGVVLAIIWHENGQQPYAPGVIDEAMQLVTAG